VFGLEVKRSLFLLASISILILLLVSDYRPAPVEGIEGVADGARAELRCVVIATHSSAKGTVLELADVNGVSFPAFLPMNATAEPIIPGTALSVVGTVSSDGDRFFFIEELVVVSSPSKG
jgi:hypothetical protein